MLNTPASTSCSSFYFEGVGQYHSFDVLFLNNDMLSKAKKIIDKTSKFVIL